MNVDVPEGANLLISIIILSNSGSITQLLPGTCSTCTHCISIKPFGLGLAIFFKIQNSNLQDLFSAL